MDQTAWEEHLREYCRSGLSVHAYAKAHGLVYHRLLYRVRRAAKRAPSPASFVAVRVGQSRLAGPLLGVVTFPNGVRIEVHDASMLAALSEWVVGQR